MTGTAGASSGSEEAKALIGRLVGEINLLLKSTPAKPAVVREFERIFWAYGDVPAIAQGVLGLEWRTATPEQRREFAEAFGGYMARKYGGRLKDYSAIRIEVNRVRPVKSYIEVRTSAYLRGRPTVDMFFLVSNRTGSAKFFNIIVEDLNLKISERTALNFIIDRNDGDLDGVIADLRAEG